SDLDLAISRFEFKFNGQEIVIKGKTKLTKFIGNNREDFKNYLEIDNGKKFYDFLRKKYKDIDKTSESFFIQFEKKFDFNKDIGSLTIYNGEWANPGTITGLIDDITYDN